MIKYYYNVLPLRANTRSRIAGKIPSTKSLNNHLVRYEFSKSNWGGDDGVKIVHRNLLLPLFSDPSDQTSELDNSRSLVDTQVAIVASAITSHVHNLSTYEGAQVTDMFQRRLKFVTALFQKY